MIEPTVAFFGATGGVTGSCLIHTLRAGHQCVALVRTPEKLRRQLQESGVSETTISSQLLIVAGSATDKSSVKSTLTVGGSGLPSTIVTGLGAAPAIGGWEICHPTRFLKMDQPNICEDAAKTLIEVLTDLYTERPKLATHKPSLVFVSTTGVTRGPEDVPWGMQTLYHGVLEVPHLDKKNMENAYRDNLISKETAVFRAVTGIRPTLLKGTSSVEDGKGLDFVKAGTEDKPATGFTVSRADVGHFMFQNLINDATAKQRWEGQMISLTY